MKAKRSADSRDSAELVIITGLSGSGKGTVLKSLEDHGYFAVDNLPIDLIPKFAELAHESPSRRKAALVVDVREGAALKRFPEVFEKVQKIIPTTLLFLEAADESLVRRFSETRRPHPLGKNETVSEAVHREREELDAIRDLADHIVDTSKFNVHELRDVIVGEFAGKRTAASILIHIYSFGFRHGVPPDSDLVFDVRFLPNPNYIPEFKPLTGLDTKVARYIRSFPQTGEFMDRITDLLTYLLPHYIREGKSYLTISFGCTGGRHRSVMIAAEMRKRLRKAGYRVKETHRDTER
jgi:UPF0042 nucleotide-binding protein